MPQKKRSDAPVRKPASAKAGNYRAPVDTTGMDPEMKRTLVKPPKRKK